MQCIPLLLLLLYYYYSTSTYLHAVRHGLLEGEDAQQVEKPPFHPHRGGGGDVIGEVGLAVRVLCTTTAATIQPIECGHIHFGIVHQVVRLCGCDEIMQLKHAGLHAQRLDADGLARPHCNSSNNNNRSTHLSNLLD